MNSSIAPEGIRSAISEKLASHSTVHMVGLRHLDSLDTWESGIGHEEMSRTVTNLLESV